MENQPIVRLNFTCNRNWEDMAAVESGRFCNDCQKKVVDFTDKTNDEIAAYLMSSTTKVCGRFQQSQLASPLPKPVWKRWLSAAAMFVAVFMGIKEVSAQINLAPAKEIKTVQLSNLKFDQVIICNFGHDGDAHFPGGEKALMQFIYANYKLTPKPKGKIITYFIVEKDGSLSNIQVLKGLTKEANDEAINVLRSMPNWIPSIANGKVFRVAYTVPFIFN